MFFTLVAVVLLYLFVQPIAEYIRVLLFGATKYSKYISTAGGALGLTMLYLLLTLFIYLLMDRKNQKQTSLFWFAVMVLLFQSLSLLSEAADRVGYYYLIFYCISLPNILEESPKFDITVKRVIALLFYLFFIAFFIYCNAGGYLEVVPYKFYWQQ